MALSREDPRQKPELQVEVDEIIGYVEPMEVSPGDIAQVKVGGMRARRQHPEY